MAYINGNKAINVNFTGLVNIDQSFNPESSNPQSGIAVDEALFSKANLQFKERADDFFFVSGDVEDGSHIYTLENMVDESAYMHSLYFSNGVQIQYGSYNNKFKVGDRCRITFDTNPYGTKYVSKFEEIFDVSDKVNIADVDQTYNSKSSNPQSGIAVAQAIANVSGGAEPLKLIKTITLEQTDTDVNVTLDKGLKEIVVKMKVAFDADQNNIALCCRSDGGQWYLLYDSINLTIAQRYFYIHAKEIAERIWEAIIPDITTPNNNGNNYAAAKIAYSTRGENISRYPKDFNFFTAGRANTFAVGSTIEIWGLEE